MSKLVLARRSHEKLVIPGVRTTIEVLEIKGQAVRLLIDAPENLKVYREELFDRLGPAELEAASDWAGPAADTPARHHLRNRVNNLVLAVALLRRQLNGHQVLASQATVDQVEEELQTLRTQLETLLGDSQPPEPLLRQGES
jgi:carbon storage regulator CsrA